MRPPGRYLAIEWNEMFEMEVKYIILNWFVCKWLVLFAYSIAQK